MTEALRLACELAKPFEGLRLTAYYCPAGMLTIGYGHTGPDVTPGMTITRERAEELLLLDMTKAMTSTLRLCPVLANDDEALAAISDFTFNLGAGHLQASTLRRRLNAWDWDAAAVELRKWVLGGGRKLPGLVLRREAEVALLLA